MQGRTRLTNDRLSKTCVNLVLNGQLGSAVSDVTHKFLEILCLTLTECYSLRADNL